jgi:6-phosphogluconolactonase
VDLDLAPDPAALARSFATWLANRIRSHVQATGRCTFAVSGGSTPGPAFAALAAMDVPWEAVHVFQVDERVAPDGDAARNATGLRRDLLDRIAIPPTNVHLMPVGVMDAAEVAAEYDATLQAVCGGRLDVVHLGLGDDGHTASWPPGDPVVHNDHDVAVVGPFNGRMRVTLTPRCVNRAADIGFLITGTGKHAVVERLLSGHEDIPASAVREDDVVVFIDRAAFEDR